jgi:hypothetical protein
MVPGVRVPHGSPRTPLGLLARRVAHKRGDGFRGVVGAGVGAATTTRRWCGRPIHSGRVLRGVARVQGEPQWVKGLVKTGHATSSRLSPARRHGRRRARRTRSGGANMTGFQRCAQVTEDVASPPLGDRARDPHGHGEASAARDGAGARMGQRPGLASRVTARACWGARLREGDAARTDVCANALWMRTRCEHAGTARRRPRRAASYGYRGLAMRTARACW